MSAGDLIIERGIKELGRRAALTLNRIVRVELYLVDRFVRQNFRSWIYFGYYG